MTLHNIATAATDVYSLAAAKNSKPNLQRRSLPPQRLRSLFPPPPSSMLWRDDGLRSQRVRGMVAPLTPPLL
jgi:hypothetical protein